MHKAMILLLLSTGGDAALIVRHTPTRNLARHRRVTMEAPFAEELNLIYDGKCGVCQWERDNLLSLGAEDKITFTDLEDAAGYDSTAPRNAGVSYADGMARITAVTRDGDVLTGMQVFRACYEQVGFGWLFAALEWPVVGPLIELAYEAFARIRTDVTRGRGLRDLVAEHEVRSTASLDQQDRVG